MSFLLKVISFPSQAEQSSGPRGLGNLFHKTDSLASIQSLGTTQPRRTNKSFSDAAPDTLRCMFHSFIPALVLLASCSEQRGQKARRKLRRSLWGSKINQSCSRLQGGKNPARCICCYDGCDRPSFPEGWYVQETLSHFTVLSLVLLDTCLCKICQRLLWAR